MMEHTRSRIADSASSHPYLVIGLAMTLIAGLAGVAVLLLARHRGVSPRELADFRRWRSHDREAA